MGRKKKEIEYINKEPIQGGVTISEKGFKIKLISKRVNPYPDITTKTDLLQFSVGEYFDHKSVIYEITNITREAIPKEKFEIWEKRIRGYGGSGSNIEELLKNYKNNEYFGACVIHYKPIFRGSKFVKTSRSKREFEIDQTYPVCYGGFHKITLEEVLNNNKHSIRGYNTKLINIQTKVKNINDKILAIESLIDSKKPVQLDPNSHITEETRKSMKDIVADVFPDLYVKA